MRWRVPDLGSPWGSGQQVCLESSAVGIGRSQHECAAEQAAKVGDSEWIHIQYAEAIAIATLGLAVNIACALILGNARHHGHEHERDPGHQHNGHRRHDDLNLRSAYLHVIADAAATSRVLLDREMDDPVVGEIRDTVETRSRAGETRIADLHVWRLGKSVDSRARLAKARRAPRNRPLHHRGPPARLVLATAGGAFKTRFWLGSRA
jgi:hypothetical protein